MRRFGFGLGLLAMALMAAGCASLRESLSKTEAMEPAGPGKVLIVMDEPDRMEALAKYLKEKGAIDSDIVRQDAMPADWSGYRAVIGYIHGGLQEPTELKLIDYTKNGGRFVCLHHMVSSGKSKNKYYFEFLGLHMDDITKAREAAEPNTHYMWREPIEKVVYNLAPGHTITSRDIVWPERRMFKPNDVPGATEKEYPAITMSRTEVYANTKRTDGDEKTLLLGYSYRDERNGVMHMQATDGWIKPSGKGHIVYIQPGHFVEEFESGILSQIVLNAVNWKPGTK